MRMKAHIGQFYTAMTTDNSPTQSNNHTAHRLCQQHIISLCPLTTNAVNTKQEKSIKMNVRKILYIIIIRSRPKQQDMK